MFEKVDKKKLGNFPSLGRFFAVEVLTNDWSGRFSIFFVIASFAFYFYGVNLTIIKDNN